MLFQFFVIPNCDRISENQLVSEKINYRVHAEYAFEQEDANVNKEKEACFTRRRRVRLASNLDGGIFPRRKR